MDNPFAALLNEGTIAKLTLLPVILQVLKVNFSFVTGKAVAVVNFLAVAALVVWANYDMMPWLPLLGAIVLGWFYTEVLYRVVVEPMAKSSNPIMPDHSNKALLALLLPAFLMLAPAAAVAEDGPKVFKLWVGPNYVTFDGGASASAWEGASGGRASLSPHISLVGSGAMGRTTSDQDYKRAAAGARITVSDAERPDFSIHVGIQHHWSDNQAVRPTEWIPDATVGWVPFAKWPDLVLGINGGYGLKTNQGMLLFALHYNITSF